MDANGGRMLLAFLVALFLAITGVMSYFTRESQEKLLSAAMTDIRRAHRILSAEPHPSFGVKRATAFLERWL